MLPPDKNQAYTPLSTISKKIGGYSINERWFHIRPGVYDSLVSLVLKMYCYSISVFRVIISVYYVLVILHDTCLSMRRQHKNMLLPYIGFEGSTVLRGYLIIPRIPNRGF